MKKENKLEKLYFNDYPSFVSEIIKSSVRNFKKEMKNVGHRTREERPRVSKI